MQSARVRFLLAHAATILLVAAPITAVALWLGARTRHYPYLNDFWPLLFQAAHLDWSNAESFRNGFFPPGYAVYLGLVTGPSILAKAYYTGVALSLGTVLLTYAVTWRLASPPPGFLAAFLTAFYPLNFSLTMITGPDSGCTFMLWLALCLMLEAACSEGATARRFEWAAAVPIFTAILWRYHALVFAVAATAAFAISFRGRMMWRAASGIAAAIAVLGVLSLLPGLSPQLARAQAFGVWEALHPVNWYHMPTDFPPTIGSVIRAEPAAFFHAYWLFHRPYLWLLALPVLAAITSQGRNRRIAIAIALLELAYLPVVGLGTSPRGVAPIVPASMLCAGLAFAAISGRLRKPSSRAVTSWVVAAAICGLAAKVCWPANRTFVETSIAGYEWRAAVEAELRAQGVTTPLQVFGDAGFHFVLHEGSGWYSYLARSNGGWPRLDLYRLEEIAPEIDTSSLDAFVADCARNGISHLVLSGTAGGLLPDLGRVYSGTLHHPSIQPTAKVAGFVILAVRPSSPTIG